MDLDEYLASERFVPNWPLYADESGILLDEVVRYENLAEHLGAVFRKVGVPFDGEIGVRAKGSYRRDRRSYRDVLSQRQREIVRQKCEVEIKLHDYAF